MRDSNGVVQPITVVAFDANGFPTSADLRLFITDTFRFARIAADKFLIGDSLGTTRLVGQIGNVQTQVASIPVTLAPAKIVRTGNLADTLSPALGADSASTISARPVSVRVLSTNDSATVGWIVRYRIIQAPEPRNPTQPAAFIVASDGRLSSVDTTDQSGTASRDVVVIANFINDGDVRAGNKIDSVVVSVSARYKGAPVPGSPLIVSVPIRVGRTQ